MKTTQNESRLDRIERNLEAFFIGMQELRESQNRTDQQILELKEAQKKTDQQLNRTDEQLNRTDEQLNRTDEQLNRTDKQLQKTIKKLDDIGYQLADLGLVQGEVAEELFYRNVKGLFKPMDMRFARIRRNVRADPDQRRGRGPVKQRGVQTQGIRGIRDRSGSTIP